MGNTIQLCQKVGFNGLDTMTAPIELADRAVARLPRTTSAEILLRTDLATAKRETFHTMGAIEACEGGVLLRGSFDDVEWYARELMRLPFGFDVREPAHLADTLAGLAWRLVQRHGRRR